MTVGDDRWAGLANWSFPPRSAEPAAGAGEDDQTSLAGDVDADDQSMVLGEDDWGDPGDGSPSGPMVASDDLTDRLPPADADATPADAARPEPPAEAMAEAMADRGRADWQVEAVAAAGEGPGPMAEAAQRLRENGGDAVEGVAAAVAGLDELGRLPVGEHVRWYDALHGELSEALASIDEV